MQLKDSFGLFGPRISSLFLYNLWLLYVVAGLQRVNINTLVETHLEMRAIGWLEEHDIFG